MKASPSTTSVLAGLSAALACLLHAGLRSQGGAESVSPPPPRFATWPRHLALVDPNGFGHRLAAADVDGDRDLDIVVGGTPYGNSGVLIHENRGDGTFLPGRRIPGASNAFSCTGIATGDVDGDGDLDVFAAQGQATPNPTRDLLLLNDGSGQFTVAGVDRFPTHPGETVGCAFGDVDGDGDLDLVIGCWQAPGRLYTNDGSGRFTDVTATHYPATFRYTTQFAFADLDRDGDLDLALANGLTSTPEPNDVYWNDGNGRFTASTLAPIAEHTSGVLAADLDHDGDLDLVFSNIRQTNRLYWNDGRGNFVDASHQLEQIPGLTNMGFVAGDVDEDGDLDLVGTGVGDGPMAYLNNGRGWFREWRQNLIPNDRVGVSEPLLADFDGDADLDLFGLFAGGPGANGRLFLNLTRHVHTQQQVRIGAPITIATFADAGTLVVPALALRQTAIPVPGLGTWRLDPTQMVLLPLRHIPGERMVTEALPLPGDPALIGRDLYTQALVVDPIAPARSRFTNWLTDRIQ